MFIIYLSLSRRQITNTKLFFKKKNVTNLLPARQSIGKLVAIRETSFLKKKLLFESLPLTNIYDERLKYEIYFFKREKSIDKNEDFPSNKWEKNTKINRYSKIEKLPQ